MAESVSHPSNLITAQAGNRSYPDEEKNPINTRCQSSIDETPDYHHRYYAGAGLYHFQPNFFVHSPQYSIELK